MIFLENVSTPAVPDKHMIPLFYVFSLIAAVGLSFGLHAMLVGHDHVFGTSREVPWGILITPYVFFACLATGLTIISSLGQVFRINAFKPLVNRAVFLAFASMLAGLVTIGFEVENPWRVLIYGVLTANPLSNIWWKSAIYTLFLLLMISNFLFLLIKKEKIARGFAIGALLAITCGNLNMNSDMALLGARGFWAENYMPLFFLIISTLLASCTLILQIFISGGFRKARSEADINTSVSALSRLMIVLLIGALGFCLGKILGGFSDQFTKNPAAMELLVRTDFAVNFWLGEVFLAVLLPLALITLGLKKRFKLVLPAGCFCAALGIFISFYDLVIVGQLVPHYHSYGLFDYPKYYSYSPSFHEYMITLGIFFFFSATAVLGEIVLNSVDLRGAGQG